jgi:MFS family permease
MNSNDSMKNQKWILTIIVLSQFCCISLWFAGNAVMNDLIVVYQLKESALGHLTSVVQFGFISGTLLFAILTISDRFSPSKVFFISALLGAFFNFLIIFEGNSYLSLIILRFLTGFFLAGIYPVGMKIAADYYQKGLGISLGFLVGALVVGTGFPHILKGFTTELTWQSVIIITSVLALLGGVILLVFVKNGPYRKPRQQFDLSVFIRVFKNPEFRSAAFGYFGHMWELYAFWAFIPLILITYQNMHPTASLNVPLLSFIIISSGGIACVMGGFISLKLGIKSTAFSALFLSCICCLISPIMFFTENTILFIAYLIMWGMVVIADSPLFSTLVANNVDRESKGTALTIVNSIGFSITIISIQMLNIMSDFINPEMMYVLLAVGPILGLIALRNRKPNSAAMSYGYDVHQ